MADLRLVVAPALPFKNGPVPAGVPVAPGISGMARDDTGTVLQAATEPGALEITLDRYAQLVLLLASMPDRRRALLVFGMSETQWTEVASGWAGRIQAEPALKAEFDAAIRKRRGG